MSEDQPNIEAASPDNSPVNSSDDTSSYQASSPQALSHQELSHQELSHQALSKNEDAKPDRDKDHAASSVASEDDASASTSDSSQAQHDDSAPAKTTPEPPLRIRYRVRFGKTGLLRWIGHTDLAKLWERLGRRAELNFSMTEGFHPKPRIAFPSALALGVESLDEVVEIELAEQLTPRELLDRLIADNQPGLTMRCVAMLPEGFGKAQ
ncbi:TIGR03936 family radical SAM-associated protein, partial [Rubripirellula amarantea]|nr:TIGR03936 family radical SAM-associated protein [Rubripirellula amarantea]